MCWFKKKTTNSGTSVVINESTTENTTVVAITLPHPEEAADVTQTVEDTDIYDVVTQCLRERNVPAENWDYWRTAIVIAIYDTWPDDMLAKGLAADTPACTWEENGVRHLASLAKWFNPGVISHELAHGSKAFLTTQQFTDFVTAYKSLLETDELLKYLYSVKAPTWGDHDTEWHAEIYRYLGEQMPEELRAYYPKLF